MNIPNFNNMRPTMSQFGPAQTMPQGYSNTVTQAVPAYQQLLAMQQQNPLINSQMALRGLGNRPVQGAPQYQQLQQQARPVSEFAGYASRQGMGDPRQIMQQIGQQGIGGYAPAVQNYGGWMDREVQRANASGMMSSGLGSLIPGLAMAAFPGAGLAKIATSAGIGGLTGGVKGALIGGLGSAVAPSIKLPGGIGGAFRAPIQAATSVAKQFANPVTMARQLASLGIGSLKPRTA